MANQPSIMQLKESPELPSRLTGKPKLVTCSMVGLDNASGKSKFIPADKGGFAKAAPADSPTGGVPQRGSGFAGFVSFEDYQIKQERPSYGTQPKWPISGGIASIHIFDFNRHESKLFTRSFSVYSITYSTADLNQIHITIPNDVFVQFRGEAPLIVDFGCQLLNTEDFDWERWWTKNREEGELNPRILVSEGKVLEIWVDEVIYTGYIIADSITKTVQMESAPTLTFKFLCLARKFVPTVRTPKTAPYMEADFAAMLAVSEHVVTPTEAVKGVPKEHKALWQNYHKQIEDSKDLKKLKEKGFLKKAWDSITKYANDPSKAMTLIQAGISGGWAAMGKLGAEYGAGAIVTGLVAGTEGRKEGALVTAMLEHGLAQQTVAALVQGEWLPAVRGGAGLGGRLIQFAPVSKPVKSWLGAGAGTLGCYSQYSYFNVKKQTLWGGGRTKATLAWKGKTKP